MIQYQRRQATFIVFSQLTKPRSAGAFPNLLLAKKGLNIPEAFDYADPT